MVFVEEVEEEPQAGKENAAESKQGGSQASAKIKKGFLQESNEPLYPPEGSPEGVVHPDTHKAHAEHKLNDDINKGMNRGAEGNNGFERPPWYTKEWPKDCQYNSPGCRLDHLEMSSHKSELHKEMVRGTRWQEAMAPGVTAMRISFSQVCDEDLDELVKRLKGNTDVTELDLTHNHIKDAGVQKLVGALAAGAAPNLKELRIHSNEFGELGKVMLTQGLPVLRKKLEIAWREPDWLKSARAAQAPAAAGASERAEATATEEAPGAAAGDEMD